MDQCNSLRRRKLRGSRRPRELKFLCYVLGQTISEKNRLDNKLKLCGVWWCSNTIVMTNTFPKLKKSSSSKISSVTKEEVICVRVHSYRIAQNKYYGAITKRMNSNYPVVETSESIEPNDNDLELNAIAYTFSNIFQPELKQLFARPCYLRRS